MDLKTILYGKSVSFGDPSKKVIDVCNLLILTYMLKYFKEIINL